MYLILLIYKTGQIMVIFFNLYMYMFCHCRNIKNAVIGNKAKKSSFIRLKIIPKIIELLVQDDTGIEFVVESVVLLGSLARGMAWQSCYWQTCLLIGWKGWRDLIRSRLRYTIFSVERLWKESLIWVMNTCNLCNCDILSNPQSVTIYKYVFLTPRSVNTML